MHPMRSACARQRSALRRGLRSIDAYAFFDLLTDASMLGEVESHLPVHRERLLPPTETLAMFLAQILRQSHLIAVFLRLHVNQCILSYQLGKDHSKPLGSFYDTLVKALSLGYQLKLLYPLLACLECF